MKSMGKMQGVGNTGGIIVGGMSAKKWAKRYVEANYKVARESCKPPYTYVALTVSWDGRVLFGEGFAKCSPRDTWSSALGFIIARGRAIADLAKQLEKLAFVEHNMMTIGNNGIRIGLTRAVADAINKEVAETLIFGGIV